MPVRRFDDQVVVVTGAGRGIGYALAEQFAREGARLVIAEKNPEVGTMSAKRLDATFAPLDAVDASGVRQAVHTIVERHGRIDVWINCAASGHSGFAVTMEPQDWDAYIGATLSGAFYCARYAGQAMLARRRGNIVNIATVNGLFAQKGHAPLCSAEAGLIMLTKVLAAEWAKGGVRVNAVARGVVMTEDVRRGIDQGFVTEQTYLSRIPMGRFGTLNDVGEAVMFVASDEASYVTGECLRVDGGWTAYHLFYPFEGAFENWNG